MFRFFALLFAMEPSRDILAFLEWWEDLGGSAFIDDVLVGILAGTTTKE